jgi:hypothetical protein
VQPGLVIIYWTIGLYSKVILRVLATKERFSSIYSLFCRTTDPNNRRLRRRSGSHAIYFHVPTPALAGIPSCDRCYDWRQGLQSRKWKQRENRQLERVVALEEGESVSLRFAMLTLTCATGALRWTMVFQNVQSDAWIGRPYDSLPGNVGCWFNNPGDVCHFRRSNIIWMHCTCMICI